MALPQNRKTSNALSARYGSPLDFIVGPQVRGILGLVILIGFGVWLFQNREVAQQGLKDLSGHSVDPTEIADKDPSHAKVQQGNYEQKDVTAKDLNLQSVPRQATLLGGWNAGAAGVLLLISVLFRGKIMGLLVILGAIVALFGTRYAPTANHWAVLGIGIGAGLLGMLLFREKVD